MVRLAGFGGYPRLFVKALARPVLAGCFLDKLRFAVVFYRRRTCAISSRVSPIHFFKMIFCCICAIVSRHVSYVLIKVNFLGVAEIRRDKTSVGMFSAGIHKIL